MQVRVEDQDGKLVLVLEDRKRTKKEALETSIQKWELIFKLHDLGIVKLDEGGVDSCALCANYFNKGCHGCPVMKKTGKHYCNNTPYRKYIEYKNIEGLSKDARTFAIHAYNQVVFLKNLRHLVK